MLHYRVKKAEALMAGGRGWRGRAFCPRFVLLVLVLAGAVVVGAEGEARAQARVKPPGQASQALSTRVVAYQIEARLDPIKKTVDATETLTYHNLTGRSLDVFPFHLYLNAFQPTSTFTREVRLYGTRGTGPESGWDAKHYGAIEVKSFEVIGQGDFTKRLEFIQPDDHNPDDHTVFQVKLAKPVAPGADAVFKIAFHDQLPEVQIRTGYKRNFFMVAQWFPKVGVWWHGSERSSQ